MICFENYWAFRVLIGAWFFKNESKAIGVDE
jgi:hypothetical protein